MRSANFALRSSFLAAVACIGFIAGCKTDDCKDAICAPCPSSRLVIAYEDSLGNCLPGFHQSAMVYAISAENPTDTAYSYNFSDSCQVGFLVDENMVYHVRANNPVRHDVIYFLATEHQEPVNVTECCLCYPLLKVDALINGDSASIEYADDQYENTPFVIRVN